MRKMCVFAFTAACSLAAVLGGCSRGKPDAAEPQQSPGNTGDTGDSDAPPGAKRAACEQEIAIECPDGMADGCGRQGDDGAPLTAYHICLPAEEQSTQPCEQEIARQCGEGLIDACLASPPAAATHLCVQASPTDQQSPPSEGPDPAGQPDQPAPEAAPGEG